MLALPFIRIINILLRLTVLISAQLCAQDLNRPLPALQLANTYHSEINIQEYWVSEKLDGVRAYWNGKQFISKQGLVYQAPEWFTKGFPKFALDGELWLARAQFDALSGIVRKHIPVDKEWQQVSYQVFDLPESDDDFDHRLTFLREYFASGKVPAWLKLIRQYKLKNEQDLQAKLKQVEVEKGEGLMLHKGGSYYHAGRDDDLLKLKSYQDAEAYVIAYSAGKGKYRGLTGALVVEAINGVQKGKVFKIGSGFSDKERQSPPGIGSLVTYKYFGLTSKGTPRFASFMRIRDGDH